MQQIALKNACFSPLAKAATNTLSRSAASGKIVKLLNIGLAFVLALSFAMDASANQRDRLKRIHDRLAGVPPTPAVLELMVAAPTLDDAADIAMQNPSFYNVTLKNFATPWTNEAQSVFAPLNDYSATVIGMVLNNDDFREVLSGDYVYTGNGIAHNLANNAHYAALENQNIDLSSVLTKVTQSIAAPAGVMTTNAAARAFFVDGTNRAMFRFTVLNHLCYDLEQLKDNTRTADRVRQDVSRSPGGDSRLFLTNCLACHAGMDPLMQAFAYYNWQYKDIDPDNPDVGRLVYTPGVVQEKYLINATNFKGGYVTTDDHWDNYWRRGPNAWIGWDAGLPSSGTGAKSLGAELANTDAFARCQVKKVFKAVCLRSPDSNDSIFDGMVTSFKADYNMKGAFRRAAVYCSSE